MGIFRSLVSQMFASVPMPKPVGYISWYKDRRPWMGHKQYLCFDPEDEMFWYSPEIKRAHRFATYEEAKARTPVYDGSAYIEERTGVTTDYGLI